MRAAVFFTPAPDSELARLAAAWLGRDAFGGHVARFEHPDRAALVAEPARYGFHATLRAPFELADGVDLDAVARRLTLFCAERPAPVIHRLILAQLDAFLALVPSDTEPNLAELEADVLTAFEPLRAPLDAAGIAKRRPDRLSQRQAEHLHSWGYPYVLDKFRFHMTLTGPLPEGADDVRRELNEHFADVLGRPLPLDGLALFVESTPGASFYVHTFQPFGLPPTHQIEQAP